MCIFVLFVYLTFKFDKNNDAFQYRYFNQIVDVLKLPSLQEMNNNNAYTPMFINAYDLFRKNKFLGVGLGSYLNKSHENFRLYKKINGYNVLPNTHPHQFHFEIQLLGVFASNLLEFLEPF